MTSLLRGLYADDEQLLLVLVFLTSDHGVISEFYTTTYFMAFRNENSHHSFFIRPSIYQKLFLAESYTHVYPVTCIVNQFSLLLVNDLDILIRYASSVTFSFNWVWSVARDTLNVAWTALTGVDYLNCCKHANLITTPNVYGLGVWVGIVVQLTSLICDLHSAYVTCTTKTYMIWAYC